MPAKSTLPRAMTGCSGTPPEMNSILEPLLAMLAICFPLVMTFVIVSLQTRKPTCGCRKASAIQCDGLQQKGAELSNAEEKHVAQ